MAPIPNTHLLQGVSVEEIPVESWGTSQVILNSSNGVAKRRGTAILNSYLDTTIISPLLLWEKLLCTAGVTWFLKQIPALEQHYLPRFLSRQLAPQLVLLSHLFTAFTSPWVWYGSAIFIRLHPAWTHPGHLLHTDTNFQHGETWI